MATVSWGEIAPAAAARAMAGFATGSEIALHAAIATAVNAAVAAGTFAPTVACSAYSAQSIQNQMVLLEGLGYTASYSGTTLTLGF